MKRILLSAAILLAVGAFVVLAGGASSGSAAGTYKIEVDNAFGLVTGADFKVAGVRAGTIQKIDLPPCASSRSGCPQNALHAVVTVQVTQKGFGEFHSDAFCQSRPQSLIGEYFIECQPGQTGKALASGSTIPVTRTQSTIPGDLLQNVMRLPYRERLTLIINELGAAVAGRSGDLQVALQRAVPALTETDNLLNLLANDSKTLQALTADSDSVITALANNSAEVQRFIVEANNAASDTATQQANLQSTLHQFPGFLEQLRPALAKLGAAADANDPVLANLNASAGQLHTLFTNLAPCSQPHVGNQCGFANAALPALKSLGKASVTGKPAVIAAGPTVSILNKFTGPVGCKTSNPPLQGCLSELAQNLAIVLRDLDNRNRAVEPDSRSPGGQGFTGLEALLQYAFNQPLAINQYNQYGHLLTVDAFIDPRCAPYATPASVASGLKQYGPSYRQCYSWLGPNQPGVNSPDPSNPGACVPDPGGAPPGKPGPKATACKLAASDVGSGSSPRSARPQASSGSSAASTKSAGASSSSSAGGGRSSPGLQQRLSQILSALGGGSVPAVSSPATSGASSAATSGASSAASSGASSAASAAGTSTSSGAAPRQAQQLLNYLLAP